MAKLSVRSRHQSIKDLSPEELASIWSLYGADHHVTESDFMERLFSMDFLTQYIDTHTDTLVGITAVRRETHVLSGKKKVDSVYSGMSFILPAYRGLHVLPKALAHYSIAIKMRNPFRSVYVWSDAISYKPYVLTARSTRLFYPSRKFPTPPHIQELIHQVGHKHYGALYNPDTGCVEKTSRRLKDYVAPIGEEELADPDIAFYAQSNPGHQVGHGLINVIPITVRNLATSFLNAYRKSRRRKKQTAPKTQATPKTYA